MYFPEKKTSFLSKAQHYRLNETKSDRSCMSIEIRYRQWCDIFWITISEEVTFNFDLNKQGMN